MDIINGHRTMQFLRHCIPLRALSTVMQRVMHSRDAVGPAEVFGVSGPYNARAQRRLGLSRPVGSYDYWLSHNALQTALEGTP